MDIKELHVKLTQVTWNWWDRLNLEEAKPVTTPGIKEEGRTNGEHEELLSDNEATKYRAVIARCNYLSPDRPDISYAVKELARAMANPTFGDMVRLKCCCV